MNWEPTSDCDTGGKMQEWLKVAMIGHDMPNTDEIRLTNKSFHTDNIYFIKYLLSCSWNKSELPEYLFKNEKLCEFLEKDIRNKNGKYFCEIYDNIFFHYRAGGNWNEISKNIHDYLTKNLKEALLPDL